MPINEEVMESIVTANVKTIPEMGSLAAGLSLQNQVSHQHIVNGYREAAFANNMRRMSELDIAEGTAVRRVATSNAGDLAASIALAQVLTKQAQSTPPETATG